MKTKKRENYTTFWDDPIVAEIRKIRDEYAAEFNYDVHKMCDDLRRREKESGRVYVDRTELAEKKAAKWRREMMKALRTGEARAKKRQAAAEKVKAQAAKVKP